MWRLGMPYRDHSIHFFLFHWWGTRSWWWQAPLKWSPKNKNKNKKVFGRNFHQRFTKALPISFGESCVSWLRDEYSFHCYNVLPTVSSFWPMWICPFMPPILSVSCFSYCSQAHAVLELLFRSLACGKSCVIYPALCCPLLVIDGLCCFPFWLHQPLKM